MTQTCDVFTKSAPTGIRTQKEFILITPKYKELLESLNSFSIQDLKLNSRQLNKVLKESKQKRDDILKSTYLTNTSIENEYQYQQKLFTEQYENIYNKELSTTKLKFHKLLSLIPAYLEITRNNFSQKNFQKDFLQKELKEEIVEEFNKQLKYGNTKYKIPKKFTSSTFKKYLYRENHNKQSQYHNLTKYIENTKSNIHFCFAHLDKFLSTGNITLLQTFVNDLSSCCEMSFLRKGDSGFKLGQTYFSRGKFCSFSRDILVSKHKDLVINAIKYYQRYNKTYSFLTIAPKNIFNLTKNDMADLGNVLKRFFNHKRIKEVYSGYFGVPEIKYKGNGEYNVHFHFMTIREEEYKKGFIHHSELKSIFKHICNTQENEKLKGSFMVDIKAPQFNAVRPDDVLNQVANYILQYITKSYDINDHDARVNLIDSLNGVRMFRSGGDLSKNILQQISIQNEFEEQLDYYDNLPQVNKYISIGGNNSLPPVQFDTTQEHFLKLKQSNVSNYEISKYFLFNGRSKTDLYQNIQYSMFGSAPMYCPFTSKESDKAKLHFSGMSRFRGKSDIRHPLFAVDALQGLGLENESKSLLDSFNMDLSKIYENDLIEDLLALTTFN